MTVGELIDHLQKHPASMLVMIESSWGEYSPDDVTSLNVCGVRVFEGGATREVTALVLES